MNHEDALIVRAAMRARLETELKPTHSLTFNFGWTERAINGDKKLATFFNCLQRKAYGRDWAARAAPPWPVAYGFFEHPDSNPHYHVLARLDATLNLPLLRFGPELWLKFARRGKLFIQPIYDLRGAISYATKAYGSEEAIGSLFVYAHTPGGIQNRD